MEFEEEILSIIDKNDLRVALNKKLQDLPFHVTTEENYIKIVKDGFIKNNKNSDFSFQFSGASQNSYFRNMGCVSIFDFVGLKNIPKEKSRSLFLGKYNYLNPVAQDKVVHILLKESSRSDLISWDGWKDCADLSQAVVPYLEFGFKGNIPISLFSKVIRTNIQN